MAARDRIESTRSKETTVDVRGGGLDFVDCGHGRDTVSADRGDIVARDCEQVRRVRRR